METWWIHHAWNHQPGEIPEGLIEHLSPPAPDVVIVTNGRRLGIEISEIVPSSFGPMNDYELEATQRRYVQEAQAMYARINGDDLYSYFGFAAGQLPATKEAVAVMVDLVTKHAPPPGERFEALHGQQKAADLLPPWLKTLCIFHQIAGLPTDWVSGSVWEGSELTQECLAERIERKSGKVDGYLRHCDEIWLLLVCDEFSIATDVLIPTAAKSWRFEHGFDRVLLMSRQEMLPF